MQVHDNPAYWLHYQIDTLSSVSVKVAVGPATGMCASFVRMDHGVGIWPLVPLMLSMQ